MCDRFGILCDMENKNQIIGVRLDDSTADRLDSLAAEFNANRSTFVRWLIGYIDDRAHPCGRLRGFREWRKRMEKISRVYCL